MSEVTVVTVFHPGADRIGFEDWTAELGETAYAAEGFVSFRLSLHDLSLQDDPHLDWATASTFTNEELLDRWLDSHACAAVLQAGAERGYRRQTSDLVFVEGGESPSGSIAYRHEVAGNQRKQFEEAQRQLVGVCSTFTGYEGATVFPASAGEEWLVVVRFRSDRRLERWLGSRERAAMLPTLRSSLTKDFAVISRTTPFASTVRVEGGKTSVTPNWKSAMMVLLVLYPIVMLLSRFLWPTLASYGAEPWLALWLSQIVSIAAMQWFLIPWVSRPFRRWLDPVDGAGWRTSLLGASVIIVVYVLSLALFASATWLQYWHVMD